MKTIPILQRCIKCPECRKYTMRKSLHQEMGKEYFCDQCHNYFGIEELVNQWNYDLGDFSQSITNDTYLSTILTIQKIKDEKYSVALSELRYFPEEDNINFDCTFAWGEPVWKSKKERDQDYDTVFEMQMGIEPWENEEIDYGNYR